MTQEKLEQRANDSILGHECSCCGYHLAEFARAELEKAAEIAQEADTNYDAVEKIRKLMD